LSGSKKVTLPELIVLYAAASVSVAPGAKPVTTNEAPAFCSVFPFARITAFASDAATLSFGFGPVIANDIAPEVLPVLEIMSAVTFTSSSPEAGTATCRTGPAVVAGALQLPGPVTQVRGPT
jgi:hypothetical protein